MKVCEKKIVNAILTGRRYADKNNMVDIDTFRNTYRVYLFGHCIATGKVGEYPSAYSFCGWNSVTTRARLRALGCDLVKDYRKGTDYVFGVEVTDYYMPFDNKGKPLNIRYL